MYYYTYSSSSTYIILRQQLTKAQLEDAALLAQLQQEGMKIDLASGYSFFVIVAHSYFLLPLCFSLSLPHLLLPLVSHHQ